MCACVHMRECVQCVSVHVCAQVYVHVCVLGCACVRVCMCVRMHVCGGHSPEHVWSMHWMFPILFLLLHRVRVSPEAWNWPAASKPSCLLWYHPPPRQPSVLGLGVYTITSVFMLKCGCWGFEPRPPGLLSKTSFLPAKPSL